MRTANETLEWLREGLKRREADVKKFSSMGNHIRAARNATAVTILQATIDFITERNDHDNVSKATG